MEWQPIETAPRDGTVILAFWDDGDVMFQLEQRYAIAKFENSWTDPLGEENWIQPTHWMPLPAPPTA